MQYSTRDLDKVVITGRQLQPGWMRVTGVVGDRKLSVDIAHDGEQDLTDQQMKRGLIRCAMYEEQRQ